MPVVNPDHQPAKPGVLRWAYAATVRDFLQSSDDSILGEIVRSTRSDIAQLQSFAWQSQLPLLREALASFSERGHLYLEYTIPRLGRRVDAVILIDHVVFVCEFKVDEVHFGRGALDQVWDYGLDLKHFYETSHAATVIPLLIATKAPPQEVILRDTLHKDRLYQPVCLGHQSLAAALNVLLSLSFTQKSNQSITASLWQSGRYHPTPTIVEAAQALYAGHNVEDISRQDAGAENLAITSHFLDHLIEQAKSEKQKVICFVTGVPGAGKTLIGLDIATKHNAPANELYSVFLSGNGPLVKVLCEALARDSVERSGQTGLCVRKSEARSAVQKFIQNVHHFRDECLADQLRPPIEHVTIFDEAQRAWNLEQTKKFMAQKKGRLNFHFSEPAFLISCMDRHPDWAVVICLIGGGQEINAGEAGIGTWLDAVRSQFPDWRVYVSDHLDAVDGSARIALDALTQAGRVHTHKALHLGASMRSFRTERLSAFVKLLLDLDTEEASRIHRELADRYPIVLTRSLSKAKQWLRDRARGNERYGIVVSSQALRLKPHAIDVRVAIDPVHWFLHDKNDVRSSVYLEDVATEFQVQGLELDWSCVVWDGDLRFSQKRWSHHQFVGTSWQNVNKKERQQYLLNSYRVLLTRARQGMVIVVPEGDTTDFTRTAHIYDPTFNFLQSLGLPILS